MDKDSPRLRRATYLSGILNRQRPTRVVDVGANPVNENPYGHLLETDLIEIFAFEPQPEAFARLEAAPKKNMTVLPHAIGDGGTAELKVLNAGPMSSLLAPNPGFMRLMHRWGRRMRINQKLPVETKRLDDLPQITGMDLLKIDVQGAETIVFDNARQHLANALIVFTEVAAIPLYDDQPLLDDQMRHLRAQGFDLHKFMFFKPGMIGSRFADGLRPRRHKNQLIDGDAVFVRSLMQLDALETEQLKHLAFLSDTFVQSLDLTLRALDILWDRGVLTEEQIRIYISDFEHLS